MGTMASEGTGWTRWSNDQPDNATRNARRAEMKRRLAADDERRARAHRAQFGARSAVIISESTLPLSGYTFKWRSDGHWLALSPTELGDPGFENEWWAWSGDTGVHGRDEVAPGDRADASWWLRWGETTPDSRVTCWLADNTDVRVVRLGHLWIAEYHSAPQGFFVEIDGREVIDVPPRRASYLPPPPHPFAATWANPRA